MSAPRRAARACTFVTVSAAVTVAIAVVMAAMMPTSAPVNAALYHRPTASPSPTACPVSQELVPRCGDWWGEAVPNAGTDLAESVAFAELQSQRPLDIVHTYHRWLQAFPTVAETALARSGHILLINWQPTDQNGNPIPWASIADGSQDGTIKAEATRLAAFHEPVMISFSHEPEADLGKEGTAEDFAGAYRRVHDVTVAAGATNVVWIWDVEGITTRHWSTVYRHLWPGSSYVDWVAWDPYNFASCKGRAWRSFRTLVTPFYNSLRTQPFRNKPLMLAELGTIGSPSGPDSKQTWYAGMRSSLPKFPRIKAVVYFDYPSPPASCDWTSNSSPAAETAFSSLARDRVFLPKSAASSLTGSLTPASHS